jgi:hypothetical protein
MTILEVGGRSMIAMSVNKMAYSQQVPPVVPISTWNCSQMNKYMFYEQVTM